MWENTIFVKLFSSNCSESQNVSFYVCFALQGFEKACLFSPTRACIFIGFPSKILIFKYNNCSIFIFGSRKFNFSFSFFCFTNSFSSVYTYCSS